MNVTLRPDDSLHDVDAEDIPLSSLKTDLTHGPSQPTLHQQPEMEEPPPTRPLSCDSSHIRFHNPSLLRWNHIGIFKLEAPEAWMAMVMKQAYRQFLGKYWNGWASMSFILELEHLMTQEQAKESIILLNKISMTRCLMSGLKISSSQNIKTSIHSMANTKHKLIYI